MSMSTQGRSDDATVVALDRPPIRQSAVVAADRSRTFDVFVRRMAQWWPLTPFSRGGERVQTVVVDEAVGGRVAEVWDDGTSWTWGDVVEWDEPTSFAMTWNVTGTPTVVALRFQRVTDGITRVELEHRGWDRLTEAELGEDCAIAGGYRSGAFHRGWEEILRRFTDTVEGRARRATAPQTEEDR